MASSRPLSQEPSNHSDGKSHITLHILSPSPEVPNKLSLDNISISLTVGELRRQITDLTPGKLPPERQRLIYQGRALQNDTLTLKDVFTQATINASDTLTLHLAVPPSSTAPSSNPPSTANPVPGITATNESHTVNTATDNGHPQAQQPMGAGPNVGHAPQIAQFQGRITFPPGQMPPQLQDVINSHIQQVISQQVGAQIPALMANHMQAGAQEAQSREQNGIYSDNLNVPWQQLQAQQQRARAAAGQNGISNQAATPALGSGDSSLPPPQSPSHIHPNSSTQSQHQHQHPPHHHHHHHHHGPQMNQPGMQRVNTPNGENFRMIIQSTSTLTSPGFTPPPGMSSPFPPPQPGMVPTFSPPQTSFPGLTPLHNPPTSRRPSPRPQESPPALYLRFQQQYTQLNEMISNGQAPSQQQIDNARATLAALPSINNFGTQGLQLQLDRISADAQAMRSSAASSNSYTAHQNDSATTTSGTGHQVISSSGPTTVYLLSSPSGPHALLMTPTGGVFSTPSNFIASPWRPTSSANHHAFPVHTSTAAPQRNGVPTTSPPVIPPEASQPNAHLRPPNAQPPHQVQRQHHHHHHHNHNHPQVPEAPQAPGNPLQNLIRILVPIGGHVWLLIRFFGFIYFITAGMGFRRTILLGAGAVILYILQSGALRPWVMHVWDPIRRHIEGLLPVPAVPPPPPPVAAAPTQTNAAGGAQQGPVHPPNAAATTTTAAATPTNPQRQPTMTPNPADTAARLLAQRQNPYFALVRDYTRRIERGLALFVGSLVPGFGERHIEARNAAEAAIAAAAAEAQRRADEEREEEGRRERDEGAGTGNGEKGDEGGGAEAAGASKQQQQQQQHHHHQQEHGQADAGASSETSEGLRRRTGAVNT